MLGRLGNSPENVRGIFGISLDLELKRPGTFPDPVRGRPDYVARTCCRKDLIRLPDYPLVIGWGIGAGTTTLWGEMLLREKGRYGEQRDLASGPAPRSRKFQFYGF